jgi:hypothetical protein
MSLNDAFLVRLALICMLREQGGGAGVWGARDGGGGGGAGGVFHQGGHGAYVGSRGGGRGGKSHIELNSVQIEYVSHKS